MSIVVYTKTGCAWCRDALSYLHEKQIPFEEREVLSNKAHFEELVKKSRQNKTPTLDIDGVIIADTDVMTIDTKLKELGITT